MHIYMMFIFKQKYIATRKKTLRETRTLYAV